MISPAVLYAVGVCIGITLFVLYEIIRFLAMIAEVLIKAHRDGKPVPHAHEGSPDTWDIEPYGVRLKRNLHKAWREF